VRKKVCILNEPGLPLQVKRGLLEEMPLIGPKHLANIYRILASEVTWGKYPVE